MFKYSLPYWHKFSLPLKLCWVFEFVCRRCLWAVNWRWKWSTIMNSWLFVSLLLNQSKQRSVTVHGRLHSWLVSVIIMRHNADFGLFVTFFRIAVCMLTLNVVYYFGQASLRKSILVNCCAGNFYSSCVVKYWEQVIMSAHGRHESRLPYYEHAAFTYSEF